MTICSVVLPDEAVVSFETYLREGGGRGIARARELGPEATALEISRAGLRGRGGAGFPTGTKWQTVANAGGRHHYVVCNGAEGEPATFKDRAILRANPYQVVEGVAIAALAVGARESFIALKQTFETEIERVTSAAREMVDAGVLGELSVGIVGGPEEYLFGEEKALLEVIEGNDPLPRWLPPYLHGLFATAPQLGWEAHEPETGHSRGHESNPTVVDNVETLAHATHILTEGADWFRSMGTEDSPGTVVCTVVGDADAPGVLEVEAGTRLREVLEACGVPRPGRRVKAVFPGVTNSVVDEAHLDTPLTYEDFTAIGSGLGAAGFLVYDETACMVEVAAMLSRFLFVESCGQCPPCKLGTGAISASLDRLAACTADSRDLDTIHHWLERVADGNRCFLPVEQQQMLGSVLRTFPADFEAHLAGRCPAPRPIPVPKIVDLADGKVRYDERQALKRPDWTYADV